MLDATESLLRERGFAGTGIKDIVARSDTPIGSLYHHFPSGKTELATEALRRHAEKARHLLASAFAPDTSVAERVRGLFSTAARGFDKSGRFKSCPIGTVSLDLSAEDSALRDVCAAAIETWVETIAGRLPWKSRTLRRAFAEMVVTAFEGAFVVSRVRHTGRPFITAGELLATVAESYGKESK